MALTIVFDHETKEIALKLRDDLCNALVGIPGFVNNEIIVNTQDIDKETLQPLNEEGNMVIVDKDGEKHEHCVRLIIDSDEQSHEIPNRIVFCKGITCETDKIETIFDDKNYRVAFARLYGLDPDKDLDLMKEIYSIITVKNVYDAKCDRIGSIVEYINKIKDFVTSERYHKINKVGRRCFENHVFEILKGIVIKSIGTENFTTDEQTLFNENETDIIPLKNLLQRGDR